MTTSKNIEIAEASARREVWFDSNGVRLFALDVGQGEPIVFVHGGLADHRAALFHVTPLAESRRLLVPDLRGSGRSVYAGPLSWDRFADDIDALLRQLGIGRAVIGGTSMGSGVALRFALRHPGRTKRVILMSPLYPGEDRGLPAPASAAMRAMDEAGQRALDNGVDALRPLFQRLPSPVREVAIEMMLGFDAASVAATTQFLASSAQPIRSVDELSSIQVPVAVIPGTDPEHPAEVAALYARHLRYPVVIDAASADQMERLAWFCDGRE